MDPLWIMALSSLLGTGAALTGGQDVENQTPAQPTGGQGPGPSPFAPDALTSEFAVLEQLANLDPAVLQAAQAANQTQQATAPVAPPPEVPAPSPTDTPTDTSIGELLLSTPAAINATAQLLGLNDTFTRSQRPAPVAGGGGGRPIPQFGAPLGRQSSIGQLLAALPGIR